MQVNGIHVSSRGEVVVMSNGLLCVLDICNTGMSWRLKLSFEELSGDFSLNASCARNWLICLVYLEKISKIFIECSKYFALLGYVNIKLYQP